MTTKKFHNHSKTPKGIKRLIYAFFCSLCGLKTAFKGDAAFRLEVFLTILIIPTALFLEIITVEKVMLIGSWMLVMIVEVINSSVEAVVDRISLEIHPLSKKIKDMASAAVFLTLLNAIIVWVVIIIGNYF